MTETGNKLIKEIVELSIAKDWLSAKEEWFLKDIRVSDEFRTCLCGHYPIKEE